MRERASGCIIACASDCDYANKRPGFSGSLLICRRRHSTLDKRKNILESLPTARVGRSGEQARCCVCTNCASECGDGGTVEKSGTDSLDVDDRRNSTLEKRGKIFLESFPTARVDWPREHARGRVTRSTRGRECDGGGGGDIEKISGAGSLGIGTTTAQHPSPPRASREGGRGVHGQRGDDTGGRETASGEERHSSVDGSTRAKGEAH